MNNTLSRINFDEKIAIAFVGLPGTGKTTTANFLVSVIHNSALISSNAMRLRHGLIDIFSDEERERLYELIVDNISEVSRDQKHIILDVNLFLSQFREIIINTLENLGYRIFVINLDSNEDDLLERIQEKLQRDILYAKVDDEPKRVIERIRKLSLTIESTNSFDVIRFNTSKNTAIYDKKSEYAGKISDIIHGIWSQEKLDKLVAQNIMPEEVVSSNIVFTCPKFEVEEARVRLQNNELQTRWYVIKRTYVGIIPVTHKGNIILTREYRSAIGGYFWGIPGGGLQNDEKPILAARRELREETGYDSHNLILFSEYNSIFATIKEKNYVFVADNLFSSPILNYENEVIELIPTTRKDTLSLILQERFADKTAMILLKYLSNYGIAPKLEKK